MQIQSAREQVNINPLSQVSNYQLAEKNRELKASNDKVVALENQLSNLIRPVSNANELQRAKEEINLLKTQI